MQLVHEDKDTDAFRREQEVDFHMYASNIPGITREELSNEELILKGAEYLQLKEKQHLHNMELTMEEKDRLDYLTTRLSPNTRAWLEHRNNRNKNRSEFTSNGILPHQAPRGLGYDPLGPTALTPEQEQREVKRCLNAATEIFNIPDSYSRIIGFQEEARDSFVEQPQEEIEETMELLERIPDYIPRLPGVSIQRNFSQLPCMQMESDFVCDTHFGCSESELLALFDTFPDFDPEIIWDEMGYFNASNMSGGNDQTKQSDEQKTLDSWGNSHTNELKIPAKSVNNEDLVMGDMATSDSVSKQLNEEVGINKNDQAEIAKVPKKICASTAAVTFANRSDDGQEVHIIGSRTMTALLHEEEGHIQQRLEEAVAEPKSTMSKTDIKDKSSDGSKGVSSSILLSENEHNTNSRNTLEPNTSFQNKVEERPNESEQAIISPQKGKTHKSTQEKGSNVRGKFEQTKSVLPFALQPHNLHHHTDADRSWGTTLQSNRQDISASRLPYENPENFVVQRSSPDLQGHSLPHGSFNFSTTDSNMAGNHTSKYPPAGFLLPHTSPTGYVATGSSVLDKRARRHGQSCSVELQTISRHSLTSPMNQGQPGSGGGSQQGRKNCLQNSPTPGQSPGGALCKRGRGNSFSSPQGSHSRSNTPYTRNATSPRFDDKPIPFKLGLGREIASIRFGDTNLRGIALSLLQDRISREDSLKLISITETNSDDLTLRVSGPLGSNLRGRMKELFPGSYIQASVA
jgi:hypothetical protein